MQGLIRDASCNAFNDARLKSATPTLNTFCVEIKSSSIFFHNCNTLANHSISKKSKSFFSWILLLLLVLSISLNLPNLNNIYKLNKKIAIFFIKFIKIIPGWGNAIINCSILSILSSFIVDKIES